MEHLVNRMPKTTLRSSPRKRGPRLFHRVAFYVYILASQRNGTLYIGHTDSISRRVWEHNVSESATSFTAKYGIHTLVHYEAFESCNAAFHRERAMKKWRRLWKLELIERFNPGWRDLTETLPLE
jgi:putative endonuclease